MWQYVIPLLTVIAHYHTAAVHASLSPILDIDYPFFWQSYTYVYVYFRNKIWDRCMDNKGNAYGKWSMDK